MSMTDVLIAIEQEVERHIPYCECMAELFDRVMKSNVARYGEELIIPVVEDLWFEHTH